jgi:DNA repair protein RadC
LQAVDPAPKLVTVNSPDAARSLFAPCFAGAAAEKIVVLHLSDERRLLALREYPGGSSEAELPLRMIFEEALRLGTSGFVIAHNHPGGDPDPSEEDLRVSRVVADTARNLGMRLIDHIIFAGGDARSLRDLGLL